MGVGRVDVEARRFGFPGVPEVEDVRVGRPPRTLCESGLTPLAGVGARFGGGFLNGDSGLGPSEGRLALNCGLVGRTAPWPSICENFEGRAGVGGVRAADAIVRWPFSVLCEGVFGVFGNESRDAAGEVRFSARWMGKKIPAPGIVVAKYCTLHDGGAYQPCLVHARLTAPCNSPFHVSIVLSLGRKLRIQLHAHKPARLASHAAHKLHNPIHIPRDIHQVAHLQINTVHLPARRAWIRHSRLSTVQRLVAGFSIHCRAGAET